MRTSVKNSLLEVFSVASHCLISILWHKIVGVGDLIMLEKIAEANFRIFVSYSVFSVASHCLVSILKHEVVGVRDLIVLDLVILSSF